MVQWILPAIACAAKDGTRALHLEAKIQKSREPLLDTVVGIWDSQTSYAIGDVVYYGGISYPGWRSKTNGNLNNTPVLGANWEHASNLDFVQSDLTTVFYLDQQILGENGLGPNIRSVSRQQALINPDARSLKFIDYTSVSGKDGTGATVGSTTLASITGAMMRGTLLDLSGTTYRTLLNLIFDDPDAFYTLFISRVTGIGYNTNRELSYIGEIDFAKLTASYEMDYKPGTSAAIQKLSDDVQAEAALNRLNTFTVRDLILTIALTDLDAFGLPQCFTGNAVSFGSGSPPTFPKSGNRFPLVGPTNPPVVIANSDKFWNNRAETLLGGPRNPFLNEQTAEPNLIIPATTSINDNLHFIKLNTVLTKIAALANFTWVSGDLQSLMTFWSDYTDQTTNVLKSLNIAIADVGFCYEYLFNIDPRCQLNVQEMQMEGGFAWSTVLGEMLPKLARSLITYIRTTYDQTNFRSEHALADALAPTGNALPSNWEPSKGTIKPRIQSALYISGKVTGYNDTLLSPRKRTGQPLSVEIGWRAKKAGMLGTVYGDSTIDLTQNSSLPLSDQWKTFQPMNGGMADGGHVVGYASDNTWTNCPGFLTDPGADHISAIDALNGGAGGPSYGHFYYLQDTIHEFVIVQGRHGNLWTASSADIYGNTPINYLFQSDVPGGWGISDPICFWDAAHGCVYGAIVDKSDRNTVIFGIPNFPQNGGGLPGGQTSHVPYVIGYGGFGMDLTVTDGRDTISSAKYDFYNNDAYGNGHIGQQINIPTKGIFTIINVVNPGGGSSSPHHAQLDRPVTGSGANLEFRIGGPTMNGASYVIGTYFYYFNFASDYRFGAGFNLSDSVGPASAGWLANTFAPSGLPDPTQFFPAFYLWKSSSLTDNFTGCYTISRMRYRDGLGYNAQTIAVGVNGVGTGTTTFSDVTDNNFTAAMVGNSIGILGVGLFMILGFVSSSAITLSGIVPSGTGYVWAVGGGVPTTNFSNAPDDSYGNSLKTFVQCQAALNLGSFQFINRQFAGVLADAGTLNGYGPLDTFAEHSQGADKAYKAQTIAVGEKAGSVSVDFLESTNPLPINDANFPTRKDAGSGGSGGGGGGLAGIGGGSPASRTGSATTWAANVLSLALIAGANNNIPINTATLVTLTAISGASSITGIASTGSRPGLTLNNATGFAVTLNNLNGGSLAANQIVTETGADLVIPNGQNVTLVYSTVDNLWHVVAASWAYFAAGGKIVNLAPGTAATDAVNVSQLVPGSTAEDFTKEFLFG